MKYEPRRATLKMAKHTENRGTVHIPEDAIIVESERVRFNAVRIVWLHPV